MRTFTSPTRALIISSLLVGLMAFLGETPVHAQSCDVYVGGDGSKSPSYTNLQDGLDNVPSGGGVCVAEGTYDTAGSTFDMTAGSSLIGGWNSDFSTQDPGVTPTVLDGSESDRVITINSSGTTLIEGVTIQNGSAGSGGGVQFHNYNNDEMVFRGVKFIGNEATSSGGGAVSIDGVSVVTFENVVARGNRAEGDGGAFWLKNVELHVINTTISGNYSAGSGGGIRIPPDSGSEITNSIVWGNDAGGDGPQLAFPYRGPMAFENSILQGSGGSGDTWDSGYGDICNCVTATDEGGNLDQNPFFNVPVDAPSHPDSVTTDGDLHVQEGSPAVDAGLSNVINLTVDVEWDPRTQNGAVDMGAYEGAVPAPTPSIVFVDKDANGTNEGTSWGDAYTKLQTALARAKGGTEIWVAEGMYYPDEGQGASNNDAGSSFELKNRVAIYGGFSGGETARSQRDPASNPVTLSGDIDRNDANSGDVVTSPSSQINGTNAYHVVTAEGVYSRAELHGVTITAGYASSSAGVSDGGGIYANDASPTLANIRIVGNYAARNGGGIATTSDKGPLVKYGTIQFNEAGQHGGGVSVTNAYFRIFSSTIAGNTAQSNGGGVYSEFPKGSFLSNAVVKGNSAGSDGGGVYTRANNNTSQGTRTLNLQSSTISGNAAGGSGGGAAGKKNGRLLVVNSIIYSNQGSEIFDSWGNLNVTVQSSLIEGGSYGDISGSPKFISPLDPASAPSTGGDLHLQPAPASDAVNAGDGNLRASDVADIDEDNNVSEPIPLDRSGAPRVRDRKMDLGAYEGSSADLTITGTPGAGGVDASWYDLGVPVQGATMGDVRRATGAGLSDVAKWGGWRYIAGAWSRLSPSDPLPAGRGLTAYFTDKGKASIDPSMTLTTTAGSVVGDNDVTVGDGTPTGDGPLSQSATWHLLANPYAVPYDLAELNSTQDFTDFQTTVHVWDSDNGTYDAIDTVPFDPSQEKTGVSPWQAFFVERMPNSNTTELTFPSEGRLPAFSNTTPYSGSKAEKDQASRGSFVGLKVVAETKNGEKVLRDKAVNLLFREDAKAEWDRYDATKLTPPTNKYVVLGPVGAGRDDNLTMKAQESLPLPSEEVIEVPLGLEVKNYEGSLTLSLAETISVPDSWTMALVDTKGTVDESDDEERVLQMEDEGYKFAVGHSGKSTANTRKSPQKQVRPAQPEPIDWTPLDATRGGKRASKASQEKPVARFQLRISRNEEKLPVEMTGFDAAVDGQRAHLTWETASETQNSGFHVQHQRLDEGDSTATGKWSSLGFVEGAGSSNDAQHYRYETESLKYGSHAFRLRQVDTDGTTTYTEPITIDVQLDGSVSVAGPHPNPVRQRATLNLTVKERQEVSVQIYDVLGRHVQTVDRATLPAENTRSLRVDASGLSSGAYFLRIVGDQFRKTRRMTVVR